MATEATPPEPYGRTVISRRNHIALSAPILREAGLRPGDRLEVTVEGRRILLHALTDVFADVMAKNAGTVDHPADHPGSLRNEWED